MFLWDCDLADSVLKKKQVEWWKILYCLCYFNVAGMLMDRKINLKFKGTYCCYMVNAVTIHNVSSKNELNTILQEGYKCFPNPWYSIPAVFWKEQDTLSSGYRVLP